ncbi:hypothetical protein ACFL0O_02395 [Thermodesulfobacteriota bacterium]
MRLWPKKKLNKEADADDMDCGRVMHDQQGQEWIKVYSKKSMTLNIIDGFFLQTMKMLDLEEFLLYTEKLKGFVCT